MRAIPLAVGALVLTSCGSVGSVGAAGPSHSAATPSVSSTSRSPSASVTLQDPARLVGSWLVSDAVDTEPGTVLRIGEDLSLWRTCGYLMGGWRASGTGLFAANLVGGDGACQRTARNPTPAWLRAAVRYDVGADGVDLLGRDGQVVARLSPGGRPTAGPHLLPSLADPPVLDARLRAVLATSTTTGSIPTSLPPATRADLLGPWVTVLPRPSSGLRQDVVPGITFRDDGTYQATDGCNGTEGGWSADDAGALAATGGFSTLIGCDNIDVAQFVATSAWAALDRGQLVLIAADGRETGRLRRP